MKCPECGSENVQVQLIEEGQQMNKKGVGFGGHINNTARSLTAIFTLGMSNLFWKKSKGKNKIKIINNKIGICQNCGNTLKIKKEKMGIAPISIFK